MKILFLATDAYGGRGGIAYYNRCLSEALAAIPSVSAITLLPRVMVEPATNVPAKVSLVESAARSKSRYIAALAARAHSDFSLVICGHINLLPLAAAFATVKRRPLVLQVHGIEAWQHKGSAARAALRAVDTVWSVSGVTRDRMNKWAQLSPAKFEVIPNTIRLEQYGVGAKRPDLLDRYGLRGKKVLLTVARLDSRERYKGIDEVIQVMPQLLQAQPDLYYVVVGDGDDRSRLEAKANGLGLSGRVLFTGHVPEQDKADVMRLADVFVMPGRGEGFGVVYLEALACGIPVVGSCLDGSREALLDGELGCLVDPDQPSQIIQGTLASLSLPRQVPRRLEYFDWPAFGERVAKAVDAIGVADH